ncbi:ATP-binding protein [Chryseolinea sp. H1M3-3]|uniref:ATP-binding protein n=1 Tax=Chryseolinea sp. H1M3-3 TaxID=3034144 RepID=UPI0023EA9891|nr:ATP-binding protein [Chryseolinea sp. H1M3-3]
MQTQYISASHDFLLGGGDMGELIRNVDWAKTPVGPVDQWPQSLRTAVSIMLNTHFPMYIAWGREFTQFYNDGYRPILGSTKHPAAMGKSTKFTFSEIWNIIGPMFEGVLEGKAVGFTDFMLPMDRHGFTEECYFIFSYSPIKQEDGSTGGVLVTVTETSERVLGERRMKTLRHLGDRTYQCKKLPEVSKRISDVLDANLFDVPFSLIYYFDAIDKKYHLQSSTGIDLEKSIFALDKIIQLAASKPLLEVPLSDVSENISFNEDTPWPEKPHHCCISLLSRADQKTGFGILVLGISSRLRYDSPYQNFFKLLTDQAITAMIAANTFEEERKRLEALAEIDRAKTAFFSNISHEFRTPLTLMLGPLEELLRYHQNLDNNQVENIGAAHRNAMRLLRLVNTLLDFSRIESGRVEASFRLVDLRTFIEDIMSNFRSIIEKAGLKFISELGDIVDDVYVDYGMWEKIVLNLFSNAFKYTLQGSIKVGLKQVDEHVVFTVTDTGVGIAEKELPHMFERFHRVAGSAGRTYEGTGIGLSLVAELVKIHKGTISVASKPGKGTTFTVSMPTGWAHLPQENINHQKNDAYTSAIADSFINEVEALGPNDSDPLTPSLKEDTKLENATVLVVDDNADMVKYIVRILERNYKIVTASNGKDALEKMSDANPDLVLSDIMMPVMDGVQLLQAIKSDAGTANIPVMLLSARAGEESRIEGYDFGADDYLVKPFSAKELLARVNAQIKISKTRSHVSKLLRQVFDQTPAAITIIKKENYTVEFANALYLQLVGKGREFIGRPLFDSLPELKDQVVKNLLDDVMATGIPHEGNQLEIFLNRQGKREKTYFNFVYHPLREEDECITGVIVVCFEVTELVNAKKKTEKSEAMLEEKVRERTLELETKNNLLLKANTELEQFAYVASHDLQEPLRKIRTFSSILQRNFPENELSKKYFEKIHSASNRMGQLIKDVLNYSRLSGQVVSYEPVDLNKTLADVLIDFELLIEERNAQIISEELPTINAVELQLRQLFGNLVSNALKFSNGNPFLKISSRTIMREEVAKYHLQANNESYVEIKFADNGIGFDPVYAEQIFVIFQRLHDKETTGTGIGLALCKKIVENHHGHIRAESSPGEGTMFFIYLPLGPTSN